VSKTEREPPRKLCPLMVIAFRGQLDEAGNLDCQREGCAWWVFKDETSGYCGILGCEAGEAQMAADIYAAAQREA